MQEPALAVVDRISRWYGQHLAVDDISFEVRRGEVLGLLGPNGAGKTTTMQILCGALAPTSGGVVIGGFDMLEAPTEARARIGYLPEQVPLYRDLSVDQYLAYCAALRRVARAGRAAAVATCKTRCGLDEVGGRLIGNLSKGYQQRVGIAQAIVHRPPLVVLDEPTVGLDPNQIVSIRALIRELGRDHSVILSTHLLPEVQGTCDRVLIINEGRLILDQSIHALGPANGEGIFNVRLRQAPPAATLAALPGVERIEELGGGRFRIHARPAHLDAAHFAEMAVQSDWGLCELVPHTNTLEDTFVRLTRGEAVTAAAEEPGP